MRRETLHWQDLRVLDFHALRAVGRNRKYFGGECRTTFMLVVLLQESGIDLLLLDLAVGLVGASFFHHDARNADVRVPDGEVEDRSSLREREEILAFENLGGVVVEYLHHLHAR